MADDKERRLQIFTINERDLISFILGKIRAISLPDGAVVYRAFLSMERMSVCVVVEHPSFAPVPDGEVIPHFQSLQFELVKPEDEPKRTPLLEWHIEPEEPESKPVKFREFF